MVDFARSRAANLKPRLKLRTFPAVILLTAALALSAGAESGEDWPRLLGPRANGVSSETNLLNQWPSNGPPVLWEKAIGTGYGAPSVIGNRLVVHHRLGD